MRLEGGRENEGWRRDVLNDTRRLGSLRPASDRPRAYFVRPTRKVPNQLNNPKIKISLFPIPFFSYTRKKKKGKTYVKTSVSSLGDLSQSTLCADLLLLFFFLFGTHKSQTFFERDGEWNERVAGVVFVDPCFDFG